MAFPLFPPTSVVSPRIWILALPFHFLLLTRLREFFFAPWLGFPRLSEAIFRFPNPSALSVFPRFVILLSAFSLSSSPLPLPPPPIASFLFLVVSVQDFLSPRRDVIQLPASLLPFLHSFPLLIAFCSLNSALFIICEFASSLISVFCKLFCIYFHSN